MPPAHVKFTVLSGAPATIPATTLVVGQKARLSSAACGDPLAALIGDAHAPVAALRAAWAASADGAKKARSSVTLADRTCSVSTSVSARTNSAERPDDIGETVRKCNQLWDSVSSAAAADARALVVVCAGEGAAVAGAVASHVARTMPTFSAKQKDGGANADNSLGARGGGPIAVDLLVVGVSADGGSVSVADAAAVARAQAIADNVRLAASLVDRPTNLCHTDFMVAEALALAEAVGATAEVIRGEELLERGFGLHYHVGRAAERPPALVVLSHGPDPASAAETVCFVGKGIVYDTGGLSIKGKEFMPGMKRDMGGSAAVLGGFAAAVAAGAGKGKVRLCALLCLAENSVSDRATRPDDVHTALSGLTVEVNNTDAEGRLVLSDGVRHAVDSLSATVVVDVATLTGAQGVTTGTRHAAVMSNDPAVEDLCVAAGKSSGDLAYPMLYCPEFTRPEFDSAVADLKNSVKNRGNAQASCAGQFIASHIAEYIEAGGRWLHVDCASPAFVRGTERGTGYGVGLIVDIVERIAAGGLNA